MAYTKIIESPELARAENVRARKETRQIENYETSMRDAQNAIQADVAEWLQTRPEYKAFIRAVAAGKDDNELLPLAVAAGHGLKTSLAAATNAINHLKLGRATALRLKPIAAKFAKQKRAYDEIQAKWEKLAKQLEKTDSPREIEKLELELFELASSRNAAMTSFFEAQHAKLEVDAACASGLI